ncbi:MAG: hypothetical protein O2898_09580 [Proteobacteria bacterium]|nr:hypothetical protein [Pseudomonadota bacterium]
MADDARQLQDLNTRIRHAATTGAVEDMLVLIERRRQFLDALPPARAARPAALIAALDEAVRDNAALVLGLEGAIEQARSRGRSTLQARYRYRKTQTHP